MTEYFAPRAKKRWCLSLYENVGNHALGIFSQAAMVSFFIFLFYCVRQTDRMVFNLTGFLVDGCRIYGIVTYACQNLAKDLVSIFLIP